MRNLPCVALGENVRLRRAFFLVFLLTFIATQAGAVQASGLASSETVVDRPDLHAATLQSGDDKGASRHASAFPHHSFFCHSSEMFSVAVKNGARRVYRAHNADVRRVHSGVWRSRAPPAAA